MAFKALKYYNRFRAYISENNTYSKWYSWCLAPERRVTSSFDKGSASPASEIQTQIQS